MTLPNEVKDAERATAQIDVEQLRKLAEAATPDNTWPFNVNVFRKALTPQNVIALLDRLEAAERATPQPTPAQGVSDAEIDKHLDAVLRASGSALRYYTMPKFLEEMREAMRNAVARSAQTNGEAA